MTLSKSAITVAKDSELVLLAADFAEMKAEIEDHPVDISQLVALSEADGTRLGADNILPDTMPVLSQPNAPFGNYQVQRTSQDGSMTWGDYHTAWAHFCNHWAVAEFNKTRGDYPTFQTFTAVMAIDDATFEDRLALVMELWSDRWLLDSWAVGRILGSIELAYGVQQDSERLRKLVEEVAGAVRQAKDTATSLDEWFASLHAVSPRVHHGMQVARELGDNRSHRLFDELSADIGAVLSSNIADHLRGGAFSHEHLKPDVFGEFPTKRELRYKLNARVSFPRFWYDLVVAWLESPDQDVPRALDEYDVLSALSYAFSESFGFCAMTLSWELPLLDS